MHSINHLAARFALWSSLGVAAALGMTGCNTTHLAGRPARIVLVENETPSDYEAALICLENSYDESLPEERRRATRDQFARKMLSVIDERFTACAEDLVIQRKAFDASADFTAAALATTSMLVSPASTKSIFAGLSALTITGKTVIDKTYFYEQTLPVLLHQMESDRQVVLAEILEGLRLDTASYLFGELQRDLHRYYTAGTIDGALIQIHQRAGVAAAKAEEKIRKDVEADRKAARVRQEAALQAIVDEASFNEMKQRILRWWESLESDERFEQMDVVVTWVRRHAGDPGPLVKEVVETDEGVAASYDPAGMGQFLENLDYSPTNRLILADIIRNAVEE